MQVEDNEVVVPYYDLHTLEIEKHEATIINGNFCPRNRWCKELAA